MLKSFPKSTALIISIFGGVGLGLAWLLPNTVTSAFLGISSVIALLLPLLNNSCFYLSYFCFGLVANLLAFYWLVPTISNFGGYPTVISILLYILFAAYHAGLYPIFLFIFKRINQNSNNFIILKAFLAWSLVKYFYPEIFPWHFAHTISEILPLIQIADIGGPILVTGLMFLVASLLLQIINIQTKKTIFLYNLLLLLIAIIYGLNRINYFNKHQADLAKVSIIQSEVAIKKSQGVAYLAANPTRYLEITNTNSLEYQPDLTIWPETVIVTPVPNSIREVGLGNLLPRIPNSNLITGSLSYEGKETFNSAFAILQSGQVLPPYHKQILMPFGEFMPFAETFPFLAELNPNFAPISSGKKISIFNLQNGIRAVPLICYEDLTPKISRQATSQGGNLLVNITNDAWFGVSVAPLQHNLIASFRAIENRRYLVRSTNAGFSTVINPLGQTIEEIPLFTEGIINTKVKLIEDQTIYTNFYGSYFWLMIVIISIGLLVYTKIKK